jgi:Sec-independent protein translocase protein TatA
VATLGVQEMIVIFLVVLVLFGPKGPRQIAEEFVKGLHEIREQNARSRYTTRLSLADATLLALLIMLLVVIAFWLATES